MKRNNEKLVAMDSIRKRENLEGFATNEAGEMMQFQKKDKEGGY